MDPEDEQMIVLGLLLLIILIDALCTQYLNMMAAAAGAWSVYKSCKGSCSHRKGP